MKTVRKSVLCAIVLLALFSSVFAYVINVSISDVDYASPSKLPGTKIQVLVGNTMLYDGVADKSGNALFNLSAGTYFFRFNRSYYPANIILYTVRADDTLDVKLNIKKSTYTLYGQVVDAPSSKWEGKIITVLDAQGQVFGGQNRVAQDGYYLIPYLYPGQTFQLRLQGDDGQKFISAPFSFDSPDAYWLPLDLSRQTLANATPTLSAPAQSQEYATIVASVRAGDKAVAGQNVSVSTPDGTLTVLTDANGAAPVYAASPGTYEFTWNNQTVRTVVEGAPPAPVQANASENASQTNGSQNEMPPILEPVLNNSNESAVTTPPDNGSAQMAGLLIIGTAAVVVVAVLVLGAVAWKMLGKKNEGRMATGGAEEEAPKNAQMPEAQKTGTGTPEAESGTRRETYHAQHAKHSAKHGHGKK